MWKKLGNAISRRKKVQLKKSAKKPSTDVQKVDAIVNDEVNDLKPHMEKFEKERSDPNQFKEIMKHFPKETEFELKVRLVGDSHPACEKERIISSRLHPTFPEFRVFIQDMTKSLKQVGQSAAQSPKECLKLCLSKHAAIRRWLYSILQYLNCIYAEGGECHGKTLRCIAQKRNRERLTTLLPPFTPKQNLEILKLYKKFKKQYFKIKKESKKSSVSSEGKKSGGDGLDIFECILDTTYYTVLCVVFWSLAGSTVYIGVDTGFIHTQSGRYIDGVWRTFYHSVPFVSESHKIVSGIIITIAVYFTIKLLISFRKLSRALGLGFGVRIGFTSTANKMPAAAAAVPPVEAAATTLASARQHTEAEAEAEAAERLRLLNNHQLKLERQLEEAKAATEAAARSARRASAGL